MRCPLTFIEAPEVVYSLEHTTSWYYLEYPLQHMDRQNIHRALHKVRAYLNRSRVQDACQTLRRVRPQTYACQNLGAHGARNFRRMDVASQRREAKTPGLTSEEVDFAFRPGHQQMGGAVGRW